MDSRGGRAEERSTGAMTERCSLWSALSAAACCFYRGSFMQVQVRGGQPPHICVYMHVCVHAGTETVLTYIA